MWASSPIALTRFQSAADKKVALAAAPVSSKVEETKAKPAVASPPPAPAAAAAKPSPKKAAVAAAPAPAPAPAPAAPVAVHKVHAAHGSDDSDDGCATATAAPLARKRRVVESDSDDDQRPQTRAGPVQTEDGEEVNFSPQKDPNASKAGKKTRERQSPSKPAPAPARPISFASAVPIAAAPAAKKKKVAPSCAVQINHVENFYALRQVWVTREFRDANGFLCSEDVEEEAALPRLAVCTRISPCFVSG